VSVNIKLEVYEFMRFEPLKFPDAISYIDDTIADMEAVLEGWNTDGRNCYKRFIPTECNEINNKHLTQVSNISENAPSCCVVRSLH